MADNVLIRGSADMGSAIAHMLFKAGFGVVIHDTKLPAATRRGMAFADAFFDGEAALEGVKARYVDDIGPLRAMLDAREILPVTALDLDRVRTLPWRVMVDARMRKRAVPEDQRGFAALTIGLGPNFVAGGNCDLAVETSWDKIGAVLRQGQTMALQGEPRSIDGVGRERFVYAPLGGLWQTKLDIADHVAAGQTIGTIDGAKVPAPISGILRGIVHDGVPVAAAAKIVEVDPRSSEVMLYGLGERPRRAAESILAVIREWATAPV